jgi:MurNAc alpha-1-phosphate uridylyltransferase
VNTDAILIDLAGDALERLVAAFDPARMDALMLLADVRRAPGYTGTGDFHLLADGRLARKEKGATAPYVWTTIQIVSRALFEGAPEGKFSTNLLWDRAIARGRLYGQVFDGEWLEVNDPGAAARADVRLRQKG